MSRVAVIAGGGPAGLTAALELLRRTDCRPLVFESDHQVGGISKTVSYRGNRMDLGGHRFFSKSDWVMDWWQDLLPLEAAGVDPLQIAYHGQQRDLVPRPGARRHPGQVMLLRSRLSRIYYRRRFFDYPLRLDAATIGNLGWLEGLRLGASYAMSRAAPRHPERTLEDFFINRFGDRLYRTFFKDYTEKVWGVPCEQISAEWGAQRVKGLSISKAVLHALQGAFRDRSGIRQKQVETSLIERFLYPRLGPGQMWEAAAERVVAGGGAVHLRHEVIGLRRCGQRVTAAEVLDLDAGTRRWVPCDQFISTMPIGTLVQQLQPGDADLAGVAGRLPHRDFMTAGLVVRRMTAAAAGRPAARAGGNAMPPDNWIYIQEPDVKLGRLQIFNNWSPDLVADPQTVSLGLEYFCGEHDALWSMPDDRFLSFAAAELASIGLIDERDVLDGTVVRVPKAYPAYFGEYGRIDTVRGFVDGFHNVFAIGRNGMHRYNNQDHSMLAARAAVDCIAHGLGGRDAIWSVNTEDEYHEERGVPAGSEAALPRDSRRAA